MVPHIETPEAARSVVEVVRYALGSFARSLHATSPPPEPRPLRGDR